jgi:hypothetical protein
MDSKIQPTPVEFAIFNRRISFYNDVLGGLAVALAFSALGTEAPRFYGVLSMVFILLIQIHHNRQYRRIYKLWQEIDHPFTIGAFAWRSGWIFMVGFLFLILVACGVLTKHGLIGFY